MNVLDENILESQRQLLQSWRVPLRQIGPDLGRKGMQDEEIIPPLLALRRPTLFTRDLGPYVRASCHSRYCLVILAVGQYDAAYFIRRLLCHPEFDTQAKRMGLVVRVMHTGVVAWRLYTEQEIRLSWPE